MFQLSTIKFYCTLVYLLSKCPKFFRHCRLPYRLFYVIYFPNPYGNFFIRIWIRESVTLVYGSGSCSFLQWFSRSKQKVSLIKKFFYVFFTVGTFTSVKKIKIKKLIGIQNAVLYKSRLFSMFCMEGSRSVSGRSTNFRIRNIVIYGSS
jgi:hypothetical protein